MSDPDIGTLSVRFSVEERRLLEDFARISGVTVEGLIREALFLPPLELRARGHLRLVHSADAQPAATAPVLHAGAPAWSPGGAGASASPAAAQSD